MIKDIRNVLITFGLVAITFGFGFSIYHEENEGDDDDYMPTNIITTNQTTNYPTVTTNQTQTTTPATTTKPSRQSKAS